jgi:hypothetical protein
MPETKSLGTGRDDTAWTRHQLEAASSLKTCEYSENQKLQTGHKLSFEHATYPARRHLPP